MSAPMPRAAPVTTATLPASGRLGVRRPGDGPALSDAEHLAVDVRRAPGEEEQHRAERGRLGAVRDEHEVRGGAGAQLLADRPGDALERPAGRALGHRPGPRGVTADDDHAGAAAEPLEGGARGSRAATRGRRASPRRVRSTTTPPSRSPSGTASTRCAPAASSPSRRAARAGVSACPPTRTGPSTSGAPGRVPAQRDRLGQAEGGGEPLPEAAADEGGVAVGAGHQAASRIATTPWPPAAQMEMRPRAPEPFSWSSLARVATMRPPVAANGCPAASEEPVTLSFARSMLPERRVEPEPVAAEVLVLPRRHRRSGRSPRTPRGSRRGRSPGGSGPAAPASGARRRPGP